MTRRQLALTLAAACALGCSGATRKGDLTKVPTPPPLANATEGDLVLDVPGGYTVERVAGGLSLPSAIAFDETGAAYVLEAGGVLGNNPGRTPPRIVRLAPGGERTAIPLRGERVVFPAAGIVWHRGAFYISHRDEEHKGVISRVDLAGNVTPIVRDLPSRGDHGTNQVIAGPDGKLYFAQGTATNSGVVGLDDFVVFGWPQRHPEVCDVPARNLVLTGKNFQTSDPRGAVPGAKAVTGAFRPFGVASERGDGVRGAVRSNGSILRCDPDGRNLEVFAWGLRNPFGLGFSPAGELWASCQGMDLRGSRPIANDVDAMLRIRQGAWYGWPDYTTDLRTLLDDSDHEPPRILGMPAEPLIDTKASDVAEPSRDDVRATLETHSSPCGFAWAPREFGPHGSKVFVAELGSFAPATDPTAVRFPGCRVAVLDSRGVPETFLANTSAGPASRMEALGRGLERPVDVKFGPDGALYVVDYGVISVEIDKAAGIVIRAREGTGAVWRVRTRETVAPPSR